MADSNRNMDYGLYERSTDRSGRNRARRPARSTPAMSTPAQIPETQSPAAQSTVPTQMSVEDFVSQPGRESLPHIQPDWFKYSNNGITKCINRMLHGLLQHPYPTYSKMPMDAQNLWFRHFTQEFTWDSHITATIRRLFDKKAALMYSRKLNEWKDMWKAGDVPREMLANPELWAGFTTYWGEDATVAISTTHSTNRNSDRKGKGKATHNLGAVSKETRKKQLFHQDGVEPSHLRLLEDAHTSRKDGQIHDAVAREIVQNVRRLGDEFLLSQPIIEGTPPLTEVPFEKINEFVFEATPKAKGRIFGIPEDSLSSTSRFYGDHSDLMSQIAERDAEIAEIKIKFQALEDEQISERLARQAERLEREAEKSERAAERERTRKLEEDNQAMMARMNAFFSRYPTSP